MQFMNNSIAIIFTSVLTIEESKIVLNQIYGGKKHPMIRQKNYPSPENFTPSRMVWLVTFCKSVRLPSMLVYKDEGMKKRELN